MYAVIDLQGHQYIVQKWDEIVVDKMDITKELELDKVLLTFDAEGKNVKIGAPYVHGTKVVVTHVRDEKGDKINILKFKRKNRYYKTQGFRPSQTILKVKDIS